MQPRFTLANQGIAKFLERENKEKKKGLSDSSAIYPSLHNRYIACVYPKYCDNKGGDFHKLSACTTAFFKCDPVTERLITAGVLSQDHT